MLGTESEQSSTTDLQGGFRPSGIKGRRLVLLAVLGGSLIPAAAQTASAYDPPEHPSSASMPWQPGQTPTPAATTFTLPPDAVGTTKPPPCPTPAYPGGPVADIGGCMGAPATTPAATRPAPNIPATTTTSAELPYTGHSADILLLSGGALIVGGATLLAARQRMRRRRPGNR